MPKLEEPNEIYWFPTHQEPDAETQHASIQGLLQELIDLPKLEQFNPQNNRDSCKQCLSNFDWTDSTSDTAAWKAIEEILIEFHNIFARHRFDIGINYDFKVKMTPFDESPVYTQSLPTPINLKDDITVELASLHMYGIFNTLPFCKCASPISAQRKPNCKLFLLVDLREINNLISDDYIKNNHPVSTLTDAAQHMAGKTFFCRLDCFQAYHCLQMADQRSVEMLAFNLACRTFAYRELGQNFNRSLSAFSSCMRECLDPVIKADQCAQYVNDIGIAANSSEQLITNLRAVFKCIQNEGLKLCRTKRHLGTKEVDFFGRSITPNAVTPQKQKIVNFLEKDKFPRSEKALQRYIGFLSFYRNYISRRAESLRFFFQVLKTTENKDKIIITTGLKTELPD